MRGKGRGISLLPSPARDHPRLCGEKKIMAIGSICAVGSPPPMRGKVGGGMRFKFPFGITPAYAGKSRRRVQEWRIQRDHPRLCGEKFCVQTGRRRDTGSPPPMRGKAYFLYFMDVVFRITPAYAGKSRHCHFLIPP